MDLLEDNTLSLPVKAHTRDRHSISDAPAFEITDVSYNPRLTRRHRALRDKINSRFIDMTMIGKPTPEDLQDPFVNYFRAQDTEYGGNAYCLFLLWSPLAKTQPDTCSILKAIDIPIKSIPPKRTGEKIKMELSEDEIFLYMRRNFYKHTKSWASYLRLRTVSAVKPIKFRLIKLHDPGFLASPVAVDFSEDGEKCQSRMDEIGEQLADRNDPEDFCYPDPDNDGKYTHTHTMCGYVNHTLSFEPTCPFEEWTILKSRIDWIDSAAFLTYYFLYPDAAKDQNTLSSRFGENFLRQYSLIEYHLRRSEERRYLVLDGLHVEEQWRTPRAIVLVIAVLFLVCMISRLMWKSWEIVFGAASFVATVAMLVLAMHDS